MPGSYAYAVSSWRVIKCYQTAICYRCRMTFIRIGIIASVVAALSVLGVLAVADWHDLQYITSHVSVDPETGQKSGRTFSGTAAWMYGFFLLIWCVSPLLGMWNAQRTRHDKAVGTQKDQRMRRLFLAVCVVGVAIMSIWAMWRDIAEAAALLILLGVLVGWGAFYFAQWLRVLLRKSDQRSVQKEGVSRQKHHREHLMYACSAFIGSIGGIYFVLPMLVPGVAPYLVAPSQSHSMALGLVWATHVSILLCAIVAGFIVARITVAHVELDAEQPTHSQRSGESKKTLQRANSSKSVPGWFVVYVLLLLGWTFAMIVR